MDLTSYILSISIKDSEVSSISVNRASNGLFYAAAYVSIKGIWYAPTEHGSGVTSGYFKTPNESLLDLKSKLEYNLRNVPCKNEKLREGR